MIGVMCTAPAWVSEDDFDERVPLIVARWDAER